MDLLGPAVVVCREPEGPGYGLRSEHRSSVLRPGSLPGGSVDLDELFA